jgi:deoxyribonuclease V
VAVSFETPATAIIFCMPVARWTPWPTTAEALIADQLALAAQRPAPYRPPADLGTIRFAACFICFERGRSGPGWAGEHGWAGAAVGRAGAFDTIDVAGRAPAPYEAGLLALREAPLLAAAIEALPKRADVLIVNATGRDHPRRAGLALHLGAALDLPSVGVTNRTLVAQGDPPPDDRLATAPVELEDDVVAYWLRTRRGTNPLAVHAGWRTDPETAVRLVSAAVSRFRTPDPLRAAREAARKARARG